MAEPRGLLVGEVSAVFTVIFTVGVFLYSNVPAPGRSSLSSLLAGIVASVVALSICAGLLFVAFGSEGGAVSPNLARERPKRDRAYRGLVVHAVPIAALAIVVVLILTLASVPVAREHTSGPQEFSISFATNFGHWNHTVAMGGFGEAVFNWSETGTYNLLHVSVISSSGSVLFVDPSTTVGSGGVVVGPGTFYLLVEESASTNTLAYVTLETEYTTGGPLLSW